MQVSGSGRFVSKKAQKAAKAAWTAKAALTALQKRSHGSSDAFGTSSPSFSFLDGCLFGSPWLVEVLSPPCSAAAFFPFLLLPC